AAEVGHPHFERDPGAGGRLLKDHPEALSPEELVRGPCSFQPFKSYRFGDDALKFVLVDIDDREKILLHAISFMCRHRFSRIFRVPMSLRWKTLPETEDAAVSAIASASSSVSPLPTNASVRDVRV